MTRATLDALEAARVFDDLGDAAARLLRRLALRTGANGQPVIERRKKLAAAAGIDLDALYPAAVVLEAAGLLRVERGLMTPNGRRFTRYFVVVADASPPRTDADTPHSHQGSRLLADAEAT